MGELLTKIKEAAESAALKAGIMEQVNEDGTPVKKPKPKKSAPAKRQKSASKTKRKVARKPKAKKPKKPVAEKPIRPLRISRPLPRITPRMPRLR